MAHIINSDQNFSPRDSNTFRVLKDKLLQHIKAKLLKPDTHYCGTVLEPYDIVKPQNIETHSFSVSIHGNNSSLN